MDPPAGGRAWGAFPPGRAAGGGSLEPRRVPPFLLLLSSTASWIPDCFFFKLSAVDPLAAPIISTVIAPAASEVLIGSLRTRLDPDLRALFNQLPGQGCVVNRGEKQANLKRR